MTSILPTKKTTPTLTWEGAKVFLYGSPKSGKTTLAAGFDSDNTLFICTEPGIGGLSVFAKPVGTWHEFLQTCLALATAEHGYKTVVIDTIDELQRMCTEHVLKDLSASMKLATPATSLGDFEWGKGWKAFADEWHRAISKLGTLGVGLVFISHAKFEEIKQRVGTIQKAVPTLSGTARTFVLGFCDFIWYAEVTADEDGTPKRILHTDASPLFEAGSRLTLPSPLPLDPQAIKAAMAQAQS
jgi:hypothetical protein